MSRSLKKIAVFFGGRSPEHDVSIVTGLQILHAIDSSRYEAFPVYVTPEGIWLVGDVLRQRGNYFLRPEHKAQTRAVRLDLQPAQGGRLWPEKKSLFGKGEPLYFDIALPCFHGLYGEDGNFQGIMEFAGIPYAGMRTLAASVLMDKAATKKILEAIGVPVLPYAVIHRPDTGYMIPEEILKTLMGPVTFPCIVKPCHLGSSIGVAKAHTLAELRACLPAIFQYDDSAIIEPFVEHLVEYNIAVTKAFGETRTSAIERPKGTDELLDFKQKYLSGGGTKSNQKGGSKTSAPPSEGMLSLTREIHPNLDPAMERNIRDWAIRMFTALNGTGAPRIDFIGNRETGDIWLNEVNPWPGSIGYFLWEAAKPSVLFTEFLNALLDEALLCHRGRALPKDPVPVDARLFERRSV